MDRDPAASTSPTVLAVVVVHGQGESVTDTLAALAAQDYPNLRVLVVDAGGNEGLAAAVATTLPGATIHRLDAPAPFGAAANEVLAGHEVAAGVEYFVFCHDDVAPARGATRALVDAALATGAGIVGPKLVDWDDPRRLLELGSLVDKGGAVLPIVAHGELDQGQQDGVRAVFAAPGAFTLVRARLFAAIGGYDEEITGFGDDLSLCWRARLAGALVAITTGARVRHREATTRRLPAAPRQRLSFRHRLRVVLTSYGIWSLVRVLPQLAAWSVVMAVAALVRLQPGRAWTVTAGWWWNLSRPRSLWLARRQVRRMRRISDRELRRIQVPGLVHPRLLLQRADLEYASRRRAARDRIEAWCSGWTRGGAVVLLVVAAVLVMGSRHLLTRGIPAVGELSPFGTSGGLVDEWLSTWRSAALGGEAPAPTVLGVVGGVQAVLLGQGGALRVVATVGLIPVGVVGAARLLRPTGSRWAPVVAAVAYAAVPLPYAALANGRWEPLAGYAAAPFLLAGLARLSGVAPFRAVSRRRDVILVGIVGGLLAMVVPAAVGLVLLMVVTLAVGCLLVADLRGAGRVLLGGIGGALVAALLQLPWAVHAAGDGTSVELWASLMGLRAPGDIDPGVLLGLSGAPLPAAPWSWGLLAAAVVPLLVGRSWRGAWSVRAWLVAVTGWAGAAMATSGWGGLDLPDPMLVLTFTGAALALAAGMGAAAIEHDVSGRSRRLGLRRAVVALGSVGLIGATVPVLRASLDGYWSMPRGDFSEVLGLVGGPAHGDAHRVLWLGDPGVLPVPGLPVEPADSGSRPTSLGFALTDGLPTLRDRWPVRANPGTDRVAEAVRLAMSRQTARLGRLLAPMAVDYVVVLQRQAPSPFDARELPAPPALIGALAGQLDLERVDVDPAVVVYRNLVAMPERAALTDPTVLAARTPAAVLRRAVAAPIDASPVLGRRTGQASWTGTIAGAATTAVQSVNRSDRWMLDVGGEPARHTPAYGWANGFVIDGGGRAVLRHDTPTGYHVLLVAQAALWLAAVVLAIRWRHPPEVPEGTATAGVVRRRRVRVRVADAGEDQGRISGNGQRRSRRRRVGAGRGSGPGVEEGATATPRPEVVESVRIIR